MTVVNRTITQMFAFVAVDPKDGDEGIVGVYTEDGWLPLVGADWARISGLAPQAQDVARRTGYEVRLIRFTTREEIPFP